MCASQNGGRSIDRHVSIIIKNSGLRFAMMARMIADDSAITERNLIEKFLPPFSKSHRPVVGGFERKRKITKSNKVAKTILNSEIGANKAIKKLSEGCERNTL